MSPQTAWAVSFLVLFCSWSFAAPGDGDSPAATVDDDWFDLQAELKAAAEPLVELPFVRLWTAKENVRLHSGLAISRNGTRVLAFTRPAGWIVYDGRDGRIVQRDETTTGLLCSALSADGTRAALGCRDGTIRIIDLETAREVHRHAAGKGSPLTVFIEEEGKFVFWLESGGELIRSHLTGEKVAATVLYDATQRERPTSLDSALAILSQRSVWNHSFSSDGEMLGVVPMPTSRTIALFVPESSRGPEKKGKQDLRFPIRNVACGRKFVVCQTDAGGILTIYQDPRGTSERADFSEHPARNTAGAGGASSLSVSSDDQWIMFAAGGQVDLRRVEMPNDSTLHRAEIEDATLLAAAPDVRRIAAIDARGFVSLHELAAEPFSPARRFKATVRRLFESERYADLERMAAAIQNDPYPYEWNRYVSNYVAFKGCLTGNGSSEAAMLQKRYRAWRDAIPDSKMIRYLAAEKSIKNAWAERGSGFASTVTQAGWEKFHTRLVDAAEMLRPVVDGPEPPPDAFAKWFEIAKGSSWTSAEIRPYVKKLLETGPEFQYPHNAMCESLLERWGGTREAGADYAAKVANQVGEGKGDVLYAAMARHITNFYREDFFDQTDFEYERIQKGNRFLMQRKETLAEGIAAALMFASFRNDRDALKELARRIETERIPYDARSFSARIGYEFALLQARDGFEPEPRRENDVISLPGNIDPQVIERLREEFEKRKKNSQPAPVDPEAT